jgi:hypothetical protein
VALDAILDASHSALQAQVISLLKASFSGKGLVNVFRFVGACRGALTVGEFNRRKGVTSAASSPEIAELKHFCGGTS